MKLKRLFAGCLSVFLTYCSSDDVQYITKEETRVYVDNEMTLEGSFCTSPPSDVEYPVKIMFIVDGSGSQQFTDQNRQRVVAVEETINSLIGTGRTYFKILVFNAAVTSTPIVDSSCDAPVYTKSQAELFDALNNLAQADSLTDYQGVLNVAYSEIQRDMSCAKSASELQRTKYIIIFISDGCPDPQCTIGIGNDLDPVDPSQPYVLCENAEYLNCVMQADGYDCGSQYGTCQPSGANGCGPTGTGNGVCCDIGADQAQKFLGGADAAEIVGGEDYNQPYQILGKVSDIMELKERYELGDLRLHTGLVLDPDANQGVLDIFCTPEEIEPLVREMAEEGEGEFRKFYGGDEISFSFINFSSLKQQRVISGFFVENRAMRVTNQGQEVDTDFDGLTDAEEDLVGTDPLHVDTDSDGYSDLIEIRGQGPFDPLDPCFPPIDDSAGDFRTRTGPCNKIDVFNDSSATPLYPCAGYHTPLRQCTYGDGICDMYGFKDTDRDGLHDCEEKAIGTSETNPDTDGDGMPDLQEMVLGLKPTLWDYDFDYDKDGIPNGVELEWHLNPVVQQDELSVQEHYRYDREFIRNTIDGGSCYEFRVRRVTLAYTKEKMDLYYLDAATNQRMPYEGAGHNEIRIYILEKMANEMKGRPLIRSACIRPTFITDTLKKPVNGMFRMDEDEYSSGTYFRYLTLDDPRFQDKMFDPLSDCVLLSE